MTTLEDVKLAVIRKLRDGTDVRNIYGEEIRKKSYPLFQVNVIPNTFATAAAGYHTDRNILVDVLYMEEDFTSYEKNCGMLELVAGILRPVLQVGDRHFTVRNASMEITDQVAHYKFYLEFTDTGNRTGDTQVPVMEEIGIRLQEAAKWDYLKYQ